MDVETAAVCEEVQAQPGEAEGLVRADRTDGGVLEGRGVDDGDSAAARDLDLVVGFDEGRGVLVEADADGEGGIVSLLPAQFSLDLLFLSHWEGILDLRVDFDPASPRTPVYSYTALVWFAAHFDLLPLSPLVGLGGGATFDGSEPGKVTGTVGACFGLALWFEASWRLTLRGAQRLNFDAEWTMPFDLLLTAEYFF